MKRPRKKPEPRSDGRHKAKLKGTLDGRKVFDWPVKVTLGEQAALAQVNHYPKGIIWVTSYTARDAADLVQFQYRKRPCTQIEVFGPRGGVACHRWVGWDSSIYQSLLDLDREPNQLRLV